jgi:short-subunit dehydrogenase
VTAPYRAVLTGAGGGIGAAIARRLVAQSDALIVVGRDRERLAALARDLSGTRVRIVCGDLCEARTVAAVTAAAREEGVNLLINNAGVSAFHAFETQEPAAIRQLIDTNLVAPMLLTRALLPQLGLAREAQVINVGSVFGALGFPGFAAYGAAKAGLAGFSQALRREVADTSIAVRHFSPRATRTAINSSAVTAMNQDLGTTVDAPEAVADAFMRFLAGRAGQHTVGARERFLVRLNQLLPHLPDQAIGRQLARIRRHLPR